MNSKKQALISQLIQEGWLKTKRVIKAFTQTPRENFVLDNYRDYAYADEPLPILGGQTISAPSMVAVMTELLEPKETDKVLEIGAGSGYQAAILGRLVKRVYTVEFDPNLAEFAEKTLKKTGIKNVEIIIGDGSKGYIKEAPYDKIIITCASPSFPKPLIEQLKISGIIIAPLGGEWHQTLTLGIKKKSGGEKKEHMACVFGPLRH